jgi:hypothetical protein
MTEEGPDSDSRIHNNDKGSSNNSNDKRITIKKRNFILSLVVVVSLSAFLVITGPVSSLVLPLFNTEDSDTEAEAAAPKSPSSSPSSSSSSSPTTTAPSSPSSSTPSSPSSAPKSSPSSSSPSSSSSPPSSAPISQAPSVASDTPGNSGNNPHGGPPGKTGNNPGQSGNTPGQNGSPPPGQSGNTPGQTRDSLPSQACATVVQGLTGIFGPYDPHGWGDGIGITCPNNGLSIRVPFPSDTIAIGQFCSPELRQKGLDLLQHIEDCQAGTCKECSPCESGGGAPGTTTCPIAVGLYQCVNLKNDPHNCGNSCSDRHDCISELGPGSFCNNRQCENPCTEPNTHFDTTFNRCVPTCTGDLTNLPPNGDCACPVLPGGTSTQCSDKCVDTTKDNKNCGSCGNTCTGGMTCQASQCQCPSDQEFFNGQCVPKCDFSIGQIRDPTTGQCGDYCSLTSGDSNIKAFVCDSQLMCEDTAASPPPGVECPPGERLSCQASGGCPNTFGWVCIPSSC